MNVFVLSFQHFLFRATGPFLADILGWRVGE